MSNSTIEEPSEQIPVVPPATLRKSNVADWLLVVVALAIALLCGWLSSHLRSLRTDHYVTGAMPGWSVMDNGLGFLVNSRHAWFRRFMEVTPWLGVAGMIFVAAVRIAGTRAAALFGLFISFAAAGAIWFLCRRVSKLDAADFDGSMPFYEAAKALTWKTLQVSSVLAFVSVLSLALGRKRR